MLLLGMSGWGVSSAHAQLRICNYNVNAESR